MSVERKDSGKWAARWRERGADGTLVNRSQGGFRTKKDAQDYEAAERLKRRQGLLPSDPAKTTFAELYEKFDNGHIKMLRKSTQEMWRGRWYPTERSIARGFKPGPHFLKHKWATYTLHEITFEAVKRWHAEMVAFGCTPQQQDDAHDALIAVLSYARSLNIIGVNVAAQIKRPGNYSAPVVTDPWLPDRIEALRFSLLDSAHNGRRDFRWARLRDATFISVLAYLGVRTWDEGAALEWDRIGDRVFIPKSKTHKARFVPLPPFLAAELRDWRIASGLRSGLVFPRSPNDQRPINSGTWSREVWAKRLAMVFGEPGDNAENATERAYYRSPYHLRHSCISMWIEEGHPVMRVARWAGHRPEETQKTYAHLFEAREDRRDMGLEVVDLNVRDEVLRVRVLYATSFSGKLPAGGGDVLTPGQADGRF